MLMLKANGSIVKLDKVMKERLINKAIKEIKKYPFNKINLSTIKEWYASENTTYPGLITITATTSNDKVFNINIGAYSYERHKTIW